MNDKSKRSATLRARFLDWLDAPLNGFDVYRAGIFAASGILSAFVFVSII